MSELQPTTLAKVLKFSNGRSSPERDDCHPNPVYGSNGVIGYSNETNAPPQTIVIGRVGSYCGSLYFSPKESWITDNAIRANALDDNDPKFLFYLLQTLGLNHWRTGSGQPLLNQTILGGIPTSIPEPNLQRVIAHILGTLDDKIELNRRMNETLEAMARAIFQSWFVDFDPVRAKASGESADSICQRLGLTPELLALFPNSFEDSELGEIPNGWAVTTLQSMTSKIGSGATPRGGREVYIEEGTSLIRSQNVYDSNFVWGGLARITDEAAKQLSGVEVKKGDVLINITGASILRTCVVDPHVLPARVNQHVAIIRAKLSFVSRYIHLHLLKASTKAHLMGLNAGASREAITKGHLESLPIIQPREELLECFGNAVAAIYAEVDELNNQKQTLEKIRDALLPKLLSGELEVREADAV